MKYNPKDASNPEFRDAGAWELLLVAAATEQLADHAEALGLPEVWSVLGDVGRAFVAASIDGEDRMAHVASRRRQIASTVGEDALWALDAWIIGEFVYFNDPTIHFLRAFRTFVLGEEKVPSPADHGLPSWVEAELASSFPIDGWDSMFEDESVEDLPASLHVSVVSIEASIQQTISRRRFRSFWRRMSARLDPAQLRALRGWVAAVEQVTSPNFDVPMPRYDGSFAGRIS